MKPGKLIIIIAALVVLLGGAYLIYGKLSAENVPAQVPENTENTGRQTYPAPDFTVYDADGKEVKLSDFIGKPVIINFWASWCGPCKMEMPEFEAAYKQYGSSIQFMMVNLTYGSETKDSAQGYISENGYTFPVFFDTKGEASGYYGVSAIPTTSFVNAKGEIEARAVGAMDAETLKRGIELVLPK